MRWYDAVLARQAVRINGFTDLFITKLDVLTGLEKIPVCVAYEVDGVRFDEIPMTQTDFHHAKPVTSTSTAGTRAFRMRNTGRAARERPQICA